ncbi:MAG: FAD-dependent oxidoreductase, partial [Betaproteobacteria bacterium]
MSSVIEVKVPDIGDFKDIPVIEVLVKPGDTVNKEDSLISLESDKATMEVPSPESGVVKELKIKIGDKVSQGASILTLELQDGAAPSADRGAPKAEAPQTSAVPTPNAPPAPVAATPAPPPAAAAPPSTPVEQGDFHAEVVVLGSGPGGYTAAFRAADLGKKVVLIERYSILGGVCLNVGCIPSKALLHAARVASEADEMSHFGLKFNKPTIELDALRGWKESIVGRLTKGLVGLAKQRKVQVVTGAAKFTKPHMLEVETPEGKKTVSFDNAIIAAGSQSSRIPGFPYDDPRLMDSTGALELKDIPKRLLVIGGGIIGLEMATVYDALGSKVTVVELLDGLIPGADRDIIKPLHNRIAKRYEAILLKTKVTKIEATKQGLQATFEGEKAPAPQTYDRILLAVGRRPNGKAINAEAAGVTVNERGYISVDRQMRTNVPHIYAIGDIVGEPMLAHKATHEGKLAAEVIAGHKVSFDARTIPSVAYTDPEVA